MRACPLIIKSASQLDLNYFRAHLHCFPVFQCPLPSPMKTFTDCCFITITWHHQSTIALLSTPLILDYCSLWFLKTCPTLHFTCAVSNCSVYQECSFPGHEASSTHSQHRASSRHIL